MDIDRQQRRLINKAKRFLRHIHHWTEQRAYDFLRKQAMDARLHRWEVAQRILDNRVLVKLAKDEAGFATALRCQLEREERARKLLDEL